MVFDGAKISIGDSVFDVAFGSGSVLEINEKTSMLRARFNTRVFSYNSLGHGQFPRKTLFWRDPIGQFVPMKKDTTWDIFSRIRDAVAKELGYL